MSERLKNLALPKFGAVYHLFQALSYVAEGTKVLARLPPKIAEAMRLAMQEIAANPFGNHPQAKRLKDTKSGYQLRHGDWRILYRVDREADTIVVERIKSRGEAYKR